MLVPYLHEVLLIHWLLEMSIVFLGFTGIVLFLMLLVASRVLGQMRPLQSGRTPLSLWLLHLLQVFPVYSGSHRDRHHPSCNQLALARTRLALQQFGL